MFVLKLCWCKAQRYRRSLSLHRPTGPIQSLSRDIVSRLCVCLCHCGIPSSWWTGDFWSIILSYLRDLFGFLLFQWYFVNWNFFGFMGLCEPAYCELAGGGSGAVALGVSDRWHATCDIDKCYMKNFLLPFLSDLVSVLLSAHVMRFRVSCLQNFLNKIICTNIVRLQKAALSKSHRLLRCQNTLTKIIFFCNLCQKFSFFVLQFWVVSIWVFKLFQFCCNLIWFINLFHNLSLSFVAICLNILSCHNLSCWLLSWHNLIFWVVTIKVFGSAQFE